PVGMAAAGGRPGRHHLSEHGLRPGRAPAVRGGVRAVGGTVLETDPYIPATPSFEPYFSRMRRSGADVLLLAAERPGAELALREMHALGLRWPVLGGDALTGIEADGALAEGIRLSSAYLPDRRDE